jgi:hypothetical protein
MHQRLIRNGWIVSVIYSIDEAIRELEVLQATRR